MSETRRGCFPAASSTCLCLPEKPPILLDDALAAFDDERLTLALELLWELSSEQQMLLFTCQKREGEILGSMPGVTKIEL